jgi:1-acyl-sn-glycerol-3-phosphate acyltransferase
MNRSQFAAGLWYAVWWCPCFVIGQLLFRYKYSGKNQVPATGPVLLVSNHQSNLDPVLVGVACPRQLKYLARKGLFFFPFNYWISALGAVPIDQEGSALTGLRITLDLLKKDNAVLVFPEGSRSPDGKIHQMMSGFCLLARRSKATIVPVAIEGAFAALPRGSALVKPHSVALKFGSPIPPVRYAGMSDAELTEIVTAEIAAAFADVRREMGLDPSDAKFPRLRNENSLLANRVESA